MSLSNNVTEKNSFCVKSFENSLVLNCLLFNQIQLLLCPYLRNISTMVDALFMKILLFNIEKLKEGPKAKSIEVFKVW